MSNIDELQEKIRVLENKLKKFESEIPKCLICHDLVECPLTINGYTNTPSLSNKSNNKKNFFYKCKSSIHNPVCYRCFIVYIHKNGNLIYTKCLHNCCKVKKNDIFSYGEIGRSVDDLPENVMWKALDKNGVTTCRECNVECDTVYNLGKHIIHECEYRFKNCYACNKLFKKKELIEHNKECNIKCKYCNLILEPGNETTFKEHFCKKKPLFKCIECKLMITREDIESNSHVNCSVINNKDIINSNQINLGPIPIGELLSTRDFLGPVFSNSPTSLINRQFDLDRQLVTPLISRPITSRPIISRNSFFNRVIQRPNLHNNEINSPILDISESNNSNIDFSENNISNIDLSENNISSQDSEDELSSIPFEDDLSTIPLDDDLSDIPF